MGSNPSPPLQETMYVSDDNLITEQDLNMKTMIKVYSPSEQHFAGVNDHVLDKKSLYAAAGIYNDTSTSPKPSKPEESVSGAPDGLSESSEDGEHEQERNLSFSRTDEEIEKAYQAYQKKNQVVLSGLSESEHPRRVQESAR
eukprot:758707-Hanusia_phi.AAC.12